LLFCRFNPRESENGPNMLGKTGRVITSTNNMHRRLFGFLLLEINS